MSDDGALFDVQQPAPTPQLSPDQRRTQRHLGLIASGVHPATRRPLLPGAQTCDTCAHIIRGRWLKCDLVPGTRGAGTDIRASWPACALWQEGQR